MRAYGYDEETFECIGEVTCQESPLEKGVFLLPANATFDAPPEAKEGKAIIWHNEAWEYIDDNRGKPVYSKSNSLARDILPYTLGVEVPEGYTTNEPPDNENKYLFEAEKWVLAPPEKEDYENALESHANQVAVQNDFRNIQACTKYTGYDNAFRVHAESLLAWYSSCWEKFFAIMNDVNAGKRKSITVEEMIDELPTYKKPEA